MSRSFLLQNLRPLDRSWLSWPVLGSLLAVCFSGVCSLLLSPGWTACCRSPGPGATAWPSEASAIAGRSFGRCARPWLVVWLMVATCSLVHFFLCSWLDYSSFARLRTVYKSWPLLKNVFSITYAPSWARPPQIPRNRRNFCTLVRFWSISPHSCWHTVRSDGSRHGTQPTFASQRRSPKKSAATRARFQDCPHVVPYTHPVHAADVACGSSLHATAWTSWLGTPCRELNHALHCVPTILVDGRAFASCAAATGATAAPSASTSAFVEPARARSLAHQARPRRRNHSQHCMWHDISPREACKCRCVRTFCLVPLRLSLGIVSCIRSTPCGQLNCFHARSLV